MDWVSRMSIAACGRRLEYLLYRLTMLASWKWTMVCCQILMPGEDAVKPAATPRRDRGWRRKTGPLFYLRLRGGWCWGQWASVNWCV